MAALEIETAEQRLAYVTESCGTDARLLARVHALLEAHEQAGLAPAFGRDEAVVVGGAGHSVLKMLAQTIDLPHVSLRESEAEGDGPMVRSNSAEVPQQRPDSRYQLQGEIAQGGMGAVIKGRDTDLGRDLAIKVLLDSHKDNPDVVQRFVEEAQIGGQLQHPGIAPV